MEITADQTSYSDFNNDVKVQNGLLVRCFAMLFVFDQQT